MNVDELQEQLDIEDEMNGEDEEDDSDSDLLIQALRDRIRAAAYLQALGQKLPFGFHFGLLQSMPDGFKKAQDVEGGLKGFGSEGGLKPFACSEKSCDAKFSSWSLLNVHLKVHKKDQVRKQTNLTNILH